VISIRTSSAELTKRIVNGVRIPLQEDFASNVSVRVSQFTRYGLDEDIAHWASLKVTPFTGILSATTMLTNKSYKDIEKRPTSLIIRRMTEDDLEAVERIEQHVFLSPWSHRAFLYELKENQFALPLVAVVDERIRGYIVAWIVADELHIGTVAVDETWRRRGVAKILLEKIFRIANERQCTRAYLEVRRSNESAQKLYERLGFHAVGVRQKYYTPQQEDAIVMAKPLNGAPADGGEEENGLV